MNLRMVSLNLSMSLLQLHFCYMMSSDCADKMANGVMRSKVVKSFGSVGSHIIELETLWRKSIDSDTSTGALDAHHSHRRRQLASRCQCLPWSVLPSWLLSSSASGCRLAVVPAAANAVAAGGGCQRPAGYCGSVLWGPTTPVERSIGRLEVVDGRGGIFKKHSPGWWDEQCRFCCWRPLQESIERTLAWQDDSTTFPQFLGSLYRPKHACFRIHTIPTYTDIWCF